ncbi:protein disulfide isomerase-like 1-1 [Silene latifolia]|uniref:protein disulfide isomerase-like 1-1 n=1 Tax=Silene latifolia TaxID=37657 RepID=UPI003D77706C
MRGFGLCFVAILLATVWGIKSEELEVTTIKEEFVITLDHSNFSQIVSKHDFIVLEFYAPWCGHCKHLAPEYEKAAAELSKNDPPITLAKIDASDEANKDIAMEFGIQGFPTLKVVRDGGKFIQEYKGPREAEGIVSYVKKQLGPASVEIKSKDDASNVIDEKKIFIAGVFPKFSGEEYENFIKLAEKLRSDYEFGHTMDVEVLPKGDSSVKGPFIRLLKPFDDLFADSKDFDLEAIEKFIEEEDSPSVVEFDMDPSNVHLGKMFASDSTKVIMLLDLSSENAAALKTKFYDIAYLLKGGNLSFLIGDVEPSKPLMQYFKLEESQAPLLFVQKSDDKKYLKANIEVDQVVAWFKKVLDGKVEQFKVSQPIPKENNEPVKVVVLDTLEDLVLNSGKEVLLEFYAPWCGHCKNLAPILDEVALSYDKDPNVLIAKYDATANDVPRETFKVQGFPTLFFINGNKEVIEYSGGRKKEDFVNFIEEHRTDKKNKSEAVDQEKDETASAKDEL